MQDRTVPRLPKLPELTKPQALLLLGGAFVFAAVVWTAFTSDLVVDRTPATPENAVLAATILDRASPDWPAFEARLPEKAREALAVTGDMRSVTLFAVPGNGADLEWWTLEAMSAVTERTGRKAYRLVPKGTSVVGFVALDGRNVPFEAKVSRGSIQARVGRDFRGLSFDANPFARGRRQLTPLMSQSAYLEKPSGVSWEGAVHHLSSMLQRFQAQTALWNLPGHVELAASATDSGALSPFVLYYRPEYGGGLAGPDLETYAKALLAESDPIGFKVAMPDDSTMVELRLDPDSVVTTRKQVGPYGERAQMTVPGGTQRMEIFYANDGEAWMSNSIDLIQAGLMGNVGAEQPTGDCEKGAKAGFASFSGRTLAAWPYFKGMSRMTFSIHNIESGMFTTCGYFTP